MPLPRTRNIKYAPALTCFILAVCIACNPGSPGNEDDRKTDSLINVLQTAAYQNPDSVLLVTENLLSQENSAYYSAGLIYVQATVLGLKGLYDRAIQKAGEALPLAKNSPRLLGKLYNEIGVSYDYKSDYKEALAHYQKAKEQFSKANDTIGYINVKNNVGLIYQNIGDLQRASTYFEECLRLSRERGYENEKIMALSNLAAVENERNNYDTALAHFREVLQADLASGNEVFVSYSYHNLAESYKNLRQFDSAAYYYTRSIEIKQRLDLQAALLNTYKGYADLLIERGDLAQAAYYLNNAFRLARISGTVDYLKDCFFLESRLAEKKGDYKTAFAAADSFHVLKDSIASARFRTELVVKEMEATYASNERLQQEEIKDLENQRLTFILFLLFFALVSAGLFFLLRKQKLLNKRLAEQKLEIEKGLALRTQLLSFIAHEIRNPLGGIIGLTDLLLQDEPTPRQKELLAYQKKASSHLLLLMNDVLDYQKLGSGKVELSNIPFHLKDVFYQVYGLYQVDIRDKNLNYELNYDHRIPQALLGDPVRLTQIFSNLLNNAIKFTEKGTISITAALTNLTDTEATIYCKVSDSGVGIPPEDQEKIFELYVQSSTNKSAQLGTGLGLSIVKNLLSLMNSRIELRSTPGMGTSFSFTIHFRLAQ